MKAKIFCSYIMGLTMGALLVSIFLNLQIFGSNLNLKGTSNESLIDYEDSMILNNQLVEYQKKIKEIEAANAELLKKVNDHKVKDEGFVEIEINPEMTYSEISDIIIDNGIYPHKNDLLMIIELLNYDKFKGADSMRANGIIYNVNTHKELLNNLEKNNERILQALHKDNLIQNISDFGKLTYLFRNDIKINPGIKTFRTNSSLREVADKLIEK